MLDRTFALLRPFLWSALSVALCTATVRAGDEPEDRRAFEAALDLPEEVIFRESGAGDWRERWMLDGEVGRVEPREDGFELHAGPERANADHVVLWTRRTFEGDVRIDYEYTRLDDATRYVNILYLFASGSGVPPYAEDIRDWTHLRTEPAMGLYFRHMNVYHISYAAFGNRDAAPGYDYVRARRYRPDLGQGLEGTALEPDYERTGLFATGIRHFITVVRRGDDLFFHVRNPEQERLFHWDTASQPPVAAGRIGLRHMFTRSARYANFVVRQILTEEEEKRWMQRKSAPRR